MYVCAHPCVCVCACARMEAKALCWVSSSIILHCILLGKVSHRTQSLPFQPLSVFALHWEGLKMCATMLVSYIGTWNLNSNPYAYKASTLPPGASPHPPTLSLYVFLYNDGFILMHAGLFCPFTGIELTVNH